MASVKGNRSKSFMQDVKQDPVVKRHVIGLIFCGAALVFDIALSFSPMHWYYRVETNPSVSTTTVSVGIWKGCIETEFAFQGREATSVCYEHDSEDFPYGELAGSKKGYQLAKTLGVTQLFQCLGLIFLVIAVLLTCLKLFKWTESSLLTPMGAAQAFWGAVCFIGSAGAFGTEIKKINTPEKDYTEYLHFSFAFAVICGFLALAGTLTLVIAAMTTKQPLHGTDPDNMDRNDAEF